ncbi:hypothetical protein QBC39DRAFT_66722 [Podospora conica]|nr:hypothetical protein QBC39DRAFT_66722 [Schizothecium conicum]
MATTIPSGRAVYKKKEGIITLAADQKSLTWAPLPGTGPPHVSLAVDKIKNLQQTPATSAKVILKIFEKPRSPDAEAPSYLFQFNSPTDARAECNAIRDILTTLMPRDPNAPKPAAEAAPKPDTNGGSADSAAMSFANAANAPKPAVLRWFDDEMLLGDGDLHQSLMKRDEALGQTYTDARAAKPLFISDAAFDKQFWSTRIGLLRAHAIELNQKRGPYNMLAIIKPYVDKHGELKLSISVDQVQLIFQQHPIVKRAYNENVPKLDDAEFWSQFFLSRLHKKLRGERINDYDDTNPIFDRYLDADATLAWDTTITPEQIPHIIDLEANEEDKGGFKGGNRRDVEMRGRSNVSIIKAINSVSGKIMAGVQAVDSEIASSSAGPDALPRDTDASTFARLDLRHLHNAPAANQIPLNVKKQDQSFSNQSAADSSHTLADATDQSPDDVLFLVSADLETVDLDPTGGIDLHRSIGIDDDSESDTGDGGAPPKHPHPASRAARKTAQTQILDGMVLNRGLPSTTPSSPDASSSPNAIPPAIAERCNLTNATTTEFLKQFWAVFYSGDPARAQELAYHEEALARCQARVRALADEAEGVRVERTEQRKREIREIFRKTGRKTPWVKLGGGRDSVMALFGGQLEALEHARGLYRKAAAGEM